MTRRGEALFRLIGDDPRFAWYGRTIILTEVGPDASSLIGDLALIQGAAACYPVTPQQAGGLHSDLQASGFKTDIFNFCILREGDDSVAKAEATLESVPLPDDLVVTRLGTGSPDADLEALAEVTLEAGVLPPPASVLRGKSRRSVILLVRNAAGEPIATAAGVQSFHRDSPLADVCWWGMLATRPARRGQKIGLHLGALAMVTMAREVGFRRFMTGIRSDNAPSLRLCEKLAVTPSGNEMVVAMDPLTFGESQLTK